MTTDYIDKGLLEEILRFLMPENATVIRFLMLTGMRIGDALAQLYQPWYDYFMCAENEVIYNEAKTGKDRVCRPPRTELEMLDLFKDGMFGRAWLFPGRDPSKPRTRQAVWMDIQRVTHLYRVDGRRLRENIGTHTARKIYAVGEYTRSISMGMGGQKALRVVQHDLNHSDPAVTMIYAMADAITHAKGHSTFVAVDRNVT